ncbi:MAG TPA: PAS domain S-box protein [Geobacteraceae bacterium]|nr:PAS domain S-box protein [Geobacteraceae bacterium]
MKESLRILILEDNPADAEMLEFELREAGFVFTSKVVSTEKEYADELKDFCPDLVLSDYDLLQYNGTKALTEAKSRCPDVPFVLVTGAAGEERAIEILTQGAGDYVLKKRLQQRLGPAVRRVLAEAEERRAPIRKAEQELQKAKGEFGQKIEEMKRELRRVEEKCRHLVETAHGWFWEVDSHVRYSFVGPQVQEILGYAPEELVGKKPFDLMPDDEATHIEQVFSFIAAKREPFKNLRNINLHKEGHFIVLSTNGVPYFDEKEDLMGYRGMNRVITEYDQPRRA